MVAMGRSYRTMPRSQNVCGYSVAIYFSEEISIPCNKLSCFVRKSPEKQVFVWMFQRNMRLIGWLIERSYKCIGPCECFIASHPTFHIIGGVIFECFN